MCKCNVNKHILQAVAKMGNDIGALCPTYDKAEQGLDILMEAMMNQELNPGEDFFIALNCAGHEIFDYVRRHSVYPVMYFCKQNIV